MKKNEEGKKPTPESKYICTVLLRFPRVPGRDKDLTICVPCPLQFVWLKARGSSDNSSLVVAKHEIFVQFVFYIFFCFEREIVLLLPFTF